MVYEFYHSEELMHSGIKGQRKGVRRFQNEDRTWTAAGKLRYGRQKAAHRIAAKASKSIGKAIRSGNIKGVGKSIGTAAKEAYKYHTSDKAKKLREDAREERRKEREAEQQKRKQEREEQAAKERAEREAKQKADREAKEKADREAKEKADREAKQLADVKRYNELRSKKTTELTADELTELVSRLDMEKKYKDLVKQTEDPKLFDAKKFAVGVLEDSGKKIISGLITYGASVAVNNILNAKVFNVQNPNGKDKPKDTPKDTPKGTPKAQKEKKK